MHFCKEISKHPLNSAGVDMQFLCDKVEYFTLQVGKFKLISQQQNKYCRERTTHDEKTNNSS